MTSPRRKTGPSGAAPQRPLEILLIEDSPAEATRTMRALRQGRIRPRITVVEDGEQALALLRSRPAFRPDVILLDWYLPRKGGREVLDDLKSDPRFRHVPIVVLSISDRQEDVDDAYSRLLARMLPGCSYVGVATHDERLIQEAIDIALRDGLGIDRFQFQMLYGVRPGFQLELVRRGYSVLVATPYGPEWYPYLMRRLAERPANIVFVARNLVRS